MIRSGRLWIDLRIDEAAAARPSRVLTRGLCLIVCLTIVVEIFIRVVFRRIGREVEDLDLDLVLVLRQPFLNRSRAFVEGGVMNAQIADNE
ncbi:MAG: hypothetical protein M3Z96_07050 [Pseudomonadota bacterium]|nr:hypothetical protein [Pseudomonadota bacterium]